MSPDYSLVDIFLFPFLFVFGFGSSAFLVVMLFTFAEWVNKKLGLDEKTRKRENHL